MVGVLQAINVNLQHRFISFEYCDLPRQSPPVKLNGIALIVIHISSGATDRRLQQQRNHADQYKIPFPPTVAAH